MSLELECATFALEGSIALITLNRPASRNALNRRLAEELLELLRRCAGEEVRAVLITGAGKAFSAGGDLLELWGGIEGEGEDLDVILQETYHPPILRLIGLPKPVIAAVNGPAVGAGCDLALACDLRLASEEARFGEVFSRVGLAPDCGGSYLLPRLVGVGKALELIFTGEIIDAAEALRIGLVNRVVPAAKLMEESLEVARALAEGPTLALGLAKRNVWQGLGLGLEAALAREAEAQGRLARTSDFREGVAAFREKREPRFRGH